MAKDQGEQIRYIHRQLNIGDPVRSRIHKQLTGPSVVGWVTTSESGLMYFLNLLFCSFFIFSPGNQS